MAYGITKNGKLVREAIAHRVVMFDEATDAQKFADSMRANDAGSIRTFSNTRRIGKYEIIEI
jgi:hypothetical protein